MCIHINSKKVFWVLLSIIFTLLLANSVGIYSKYWLDYDHVFGLIPLFDFNHEVNIPTFYSSFALLFASRLLFLVAFEHRSRNAKYVSWLVLALIFIFLAIDEAVSIHEIIGDQLRITLNTSGFLYFAWIIPYGLGAVIFLAVYARFLLLLPSYTRIRFIFSGLIFVTGAIGFEAIGGWYFELNGAGHYIYAVLYSCEELCEMLGVAAFIYFLLEYLEVEFGGEVLIVNRFVMKIC